MAYRRLDKRGQVQVSTKIRVANDPRGIRAAAAVEAINRDLEAYWRGLAAGGAVEARARASEPHPLEAARVRAAEMTAHWSNGRAAMVYAVSAEGRAALVPDGCGQYQPSVKRGAK